MTKNNPWLYSYAWRDQFYPGHVTVKEAAKLLPVSAQTIRRKIKSGQLKSVNIGSANRQFYLIHKDELKTLLPENLRDIVQF